MESSTTLLDRKKKELQQLIQIQEGLQRRKLEIANARARTQGRQPVSDTDAAMSQHFQTVYDNIYPILSSIHKEELHVRDLKDKLRQSSAARERDAVRLGIQQVVERLARGDNSTTPHQMSGWADQLRDRSTITNSAETSVSDVQFSVSPCKLPDQTTETLSFLLCHHGVCVLTTLTLQSRVPAIGPPIEAQVNTDPYIPGLETVVADSLRQGQSVREVLSHITHTIATDILPFI